MSKVNIIDILFAVSTIGGVGEGFIAYKSCGLEYGIILGIVTWSIFLLMSLAVIGIVNATA